MCGLGGVTTVNPASTGAAAAAAVAIQSDSGQLLLFVTLSFTLSPPCARPPTNTFASVNS